MRGGREVYPPHYQPQNTAHGSSPALAPGGSALAADIPLRRGIWRVGGFGGGLRISMPFSSNPRVSIYFESSLFTINNPKSNGSAFKCLHRLWTSARSGLLTMETNIHRNTVSDARSGRSVDTLRPREAFSEVAVRSRSCTEELMKR